jgi:hypothetical protein
MQFSESQRGAPLVTEGRIRTNTCGEGREKGVLSTLVHPPFAQQAVGRAVRWQGKAAYLELFQLKLVIQPRASDLHGTLRPLVPVFLAVVVLAKQGSQFPAPE